MVDYRWRKNVDSDSKSIDEQLKKVAVGSR